MLVGIHFVWKWVPIRWLPDAPHRWWWYWSLCQHWYQHSSHMMKYRSINSIESSKKNSIFGRYGSLFALCFRVIIYVVINLTWQRQWHKNERAHILNQQKKTSHTNNGVWSTKMLFITMALIIFQQNMGWHDVLTAQKRTKWKQKGEIKAKKSNTKKIENEQKWKKKEKKTEERNENKKRKKKTENKPKTKKELKS